MNSHTPILTDEARKLVLEAIRVFSKLLEHQDFALLPQIFLVNTKGEKKSVVVHGGRDLESGTAEDHLLAGREVLERLSRLPDVVRNAALAYDSYLTLGGQEMSAIGVEMLGPGVTHIFAQQYAIGRGGKVDLIGEPLYRTEPRSEPSPS
jgi:hypothetical protein